MATPVTAECHTCCTTLRRASRPVSWGHGRMCGRRNDRGSIQAARPSIGDPPTHLGTPRGRPGNGHSIASHI